MLNQRRKFWRGADRKFKLSLPSGAIRATGLMCGPGRPQVGLCSDIRRPEDSTIITKKAKKLAGVFFSKALRTACTGVAQMNAAIEKNEFALVKGLPEAPTIAHDKSLDLFPTQRVSLLLPSRSFPPHLLKSESHRFEQGFSNPAAICTRAIVATWHFTVAGFFPTFTRSSMNARMVLGSTGR
jgi:hypothetical protein